MSYARLAGSASFSDNELESVSGATVATTPLLRFTPKLGRETLDRVHVAYVAEARAKKRTAAEELAEADVFLRDKTSAFARIVKNSERRAR